MTDGFDGPQLIGALVGLGFIAFGLVFIISPLRLRARRRTWTRTDAVIDRLEKRSRSDNSGGRRRWLQADYHYTDANGVLRRGNGPLPRGISFGPDAAERTMPVIYDPRSPDRSAPDAGTPAVGCGITFGIVFAAVGAGLIWFLLVVV